MLSGEGGKLVVARRPLSWLVPGGMLLLYSLASVLIMVSIDPDASYPPHSVAGRLRAALLGGDGGLGTGAFPYNP